MWLDKPQCLHQTDCRNSLCSEDTWGKEQLVHGPTLFARFQKLCEILGRRSNHSQRNEFGDWQMHQKIKTAIRFLVRGQSANVLTLSSEEAPWPYDGHGTTKLLAI